MRKNTSRTRMIRSQLKTAARASKRISKKKENFKAWVQSKITKASDYLILLLIILIVKI